MKSKITCMFVLVGATACLVAAPAGAASSKKFNIKSSGSLSGTKMKGEVHGSPFGKGTFTGVVNFSTGHVVQVWKFKGGTITMTTTQKITHGTVSSGSITLTKGTGKYKGAKGTGTGGGDNVTGKFTYKGKIKL